MDEKKGQVAHAGVLSNVQIGLDSGKFRNWPWTGLPSSVKQLRTSSTFLFAVLVAHSNRVPFTWRASSDWEFLTLRDADNTSRALNYEHVLRSPACLNGSGGFGASSSGNGTLPRSRVESHPNALLEEKCYFDFY